MKKPVKVIVICVAALAALLVLRFMVFAPRPNDQELIRQALTESIEASREGRPGGVMDKLSESLRINGVSPGSRSRVAKFIRDNKPDVEVQDTTAFVTGDTARITSPVHVRISFLTMNWNQRVDNVTLIFERENARKWLVFPTRQWRLKEVVVPQDSVPIDLPMGGQTGGWQF